MEKKKFCRPDQVLRVAVGLEFDNNSLPSVSDETEGIAEVRPTDGKDTTKVYLDLQDIVNPCQFQIVVPELVRGAPWGELLFNRRPGFLVNFGRKLEDMHFGFNEGKFYMPIRLYPLEKAPTPDWYFDPLYVRVDKGEKLYYFVIGAEWSDNIITVETNHEPKRRDIPYFLR